MTTELPKSYDPAAIETEAYRIWLEEKCFHAEPTDPGDPYAIVIPPPNVTAALHLGHALNNTLQDILIRQKRMEGKNAVWLPGTDHAGIATQAIVEKRVLAEEGKRRTDFPREEFVKKIQAWKDEYEARIIGQLKVMGCSCDWDRLAFTMDEARAKAVREAFFRLFKDGLIYRGKRLVNWDPATQTALADDEVEMEEVDGHFYYLRYPLVTEGSTGILPVSAASGHGQDARATEYVVVATTRPETMLGDTAVAINPKDPRAAALRGRKVRLPIVNRIVPIVEDDYVVMPDPDSQDAKAKFATGFLKVTPAHDPNDYDIGQRHKLPLINIFSPTAAVSKDHGWPAEDVANADPFLAELLGKDRVEARKLVVKYFKEHGLLEEVKPYRHSVGHSYRSHVAIEPYLSDQWYCKVTDPRLAGAALKAMSAEQVDRSTGIPPVQPGNESSTGIPPVPENAGHGQDARATSQRQLIFHPARYAKTFQTWHENIRDWCISRQLWWGHRIPVWKLEWDVRSKESGELIWDKSEVLGHFSQWLQEVGIDEDVVISGNESGKPSILICTRTATADARFAELRSITYRANRAADEEYGERYPTGPHLMQMISCLEQDPDVLDTWFSSALWPMSTLGWPEDSALSTQHSALNFWNPTHTLCTAREIITLWVSRMVMFNLYFLDRLPFVDVFIHAMIQDGHGQKMSKSLGNGVDPVDIIHSHGADAMRFTLASMATNTQDVRMPVDMVDPHSGEVFMPKFVTDSAGYLVAAPIQESPKDPKKKIVSSYGYASGKAQPTADMPVARNTSSKFDLGRNFCNKIWNAARFVLSNLESIKNHQSKIENRVDETRWSMADRWIVSRFNRTVAEANESLAIYRFDQYAKACYDFFWRDFCDWYLEAIKLDMKDPAKSGQIAQILAALLDGTLRLMHPMIPFITETIWQKLNEVWPTRGLPGRIEFPPIANRKLQNANRLILAPWPSVGDFSQAAEHIFPKLQEIIVAIRNIRSDFKVDPKKPVTVSIRATGDSGRQIESHRGMIESLAVCKLAAVSTDLAQPPGSSKASAAGCDIYAEGLIDKDAEQQRNTKRTEELTKQIATLKARMSNEAYMSKAPPALVKQTQDQLAAAEAELAKL